MKTVFTLLAVTLMMAFYSCSSQQQLVKQKDDTSNIIKLIALNSNDSIRVSVHVNTAKEELKMFSVNLRTSGVLSLQINLNLTHPSQGIKLQFRRQDFKMSFENGVFRYALDPDKVYERNRINITAAAFSFGLLGALAAQSTDKNRTHIFRDASIQEAILDNNNSKISGLLFFDISGIATIEPKTLLIEYENLADANMETLNMDLK